MVHETLSLLPQHFSFIWRAAGFSRFSMLGALVNCINVASTPKTPCHQLRISIVMSESMPKEDGGAEMEVSVFDPVFVRHH